METIAETSQAPAAPTTSPTGETTLAAWKEARRDYAAVQRRMWQTAVVLAPLAFAGLALLARVQCPVPMDFVSLGGASAAMMLLWHYVGERSQVVRDRAGEELRTAETALGQRPIALESGSSDRRIRVTLTVLLIVLWAASWVVRPDCSVIPDEETDLTAFNVSP